MAERSVSNPAIPLGKPTLKGRRLALALIIGWLAQGWKHHRVIESYPQPGNDDFAADMPSAVAGERLRRARRAPLRKGTQP